MQPTWQWNDYWTWMLVVDVLFAAVMIVCTAVACQYWRHRSGPLQFGLWWIFALVFALALTITLFRHQMIDWTALFHLPLAVGVLSLPAVVGIGVYELAQRMDRQAEKRTRRWKEVVRSSIASTGSES